MAGAAEHTAVISNRGNGMTQPYGLCEGVVFDSHADATSHVIRVGLWLVGVVRCFQCNGFHLATHKAGSGD